MSQTYPAFDGTQFPDRLDSFPKMRDVSVSMLPYAKEYQALVDRGSINEAAQLLETYPELAETMLNAAKINRLQDAIQAIETFYMNDVQSYILNAVQYKGTWSPNTSYSKYDVVMYTVNGVDLAFMALDLSVPLGLAPLDSELWLPITLKGDKGDKGEQGIQGIQGEQGIQGVMGFTGERGEKGDVGPQGPPGEQGLQGEMGPVGPQGAVGATGDVGPQGPQGIQGEPGEQGPPGKDGVDGADGVSFIYRELWDENKTYNSDDAVTHDNCLWGAKHDGVTSVPSEANSDDWCLILEGVSRGTAKTVIDIPVQAEKLIYNRYYQQPTWDNYIPGTVTIIGTIRAKNAGIYEVLMTPTVNAEWSDGTTEAKVVSWEIEPMHLTEVPQQGNYLVYDGNIHSPKWMGFEDDAFTITGISETSEAGVYSVVLTCSPNYVFDFSRFVRVIPSQSKNNMPVYDGTEITPVWDNYNPEQLSISGETSGIDAGQYEVTFTLNDGYEFALDDE